MSLGEGQSNYLAAEQADFEILQFALRSASSSVSSVIMLLMKVHKIPETYSIIMLNHT